jgi:hypothetical protein
MSIWDEISFTDNRKTAGLDEILSERLTPSDLVDKKRVASRAKKSSQFVEGVRVVSHTNNGLLIPNTLPLAGTKGVVVSVKTASGDVTQMDGEVFVKWEGRGHKIDRAPIDFLRVASKKVASLEDFIVLSGPSLITASADTEGELVHKSTKDLWSVKVSADGLYEIERLFDENGDPIKV